MQNIERLTYFDENIDQVFPGICEELYEHLRDELVSKLIEYDVRKVSLYDRFCELLELPESE